MNKHYTGYKLIGAGLVLGTGLLVGYCTRDYIADKETIKLYQNQPPTSLTVEGDYINAQNHSVAIKSTTEKNYQSKNSGHSNNGTNAGATHSKPNRDLLEERIRINELKTKALEKKLETSVTPTTSPQNNQNTQSNAVTIYKDSNGNMQADDQPVTVYQNPTDPNIIMIYAGVNGNNKDVFIENKPLYINGETYGSMRYMPLELIRDDVYSWNILNMTMLGFVSRFGPNYLFDGMRYNAFNGPMNERFSNIRYNMPRFEPRPASLPRRNGGRR